MAIAMRSLAPNAALRRGMLYHGGESVSLTRRIIAASSSAAAIGFIEMGGAHGGMKSYAGVGVAAAVKQAALPLLFRQRVKCPPKMGERRGHQMRIGVVRRIISPQIAGNIGVAEANSRVVGMAYRHLSDAHHAASIPCDMAAASARKQRRRHRRITEIDDAFSYVGMSKCGIMPLLRRPSAFPSAR